MILLTQVGQGFPLSRTICHKFLYTRLEFSSVIYGCVILLSSLRLFDTVVVCSSAGIKRQEASHHIARVSASYHPEVVF